MSNDDRKQGYKPPSITQKRKQSDIEMNSISNSNMKKKKSSAGSIKNSRSKAAFWRISEIPVKVVTKLTVVFYLFFLRPK